MDKFEGMIYSVLDKLEQEGKIISKPIVGESNDVLIQPTAKLFNED